MLDDKNGLWVVVPVLSTFAILMPGPAAAVWGLVVIVRRKTMLTRRKIITGWPAVVLGVIAFVLGSVYAPLLIYWSIVHYPRGW
jgi:hypothetical protein